VLVHFSSLPFAFAFLVLSLYDSLIAFFFLGLEAFLPTFNHRFCKHEKPEYHTTNDDQTDESEDALTDGGGGEDGRMRYSGGKHTRRHLNRWTQSNA